MSLRRRMQVLKVLQDRPTSRLRAVEIAEHAGLALIHVELASLVEEGWVDTEHENGSPRLYWLKLP